MQNAYPDIKASGAIGWIKSHPIVSFFVLTYLISWTAWGIIILDISSALDFPMTMIAQFGPFLAAMIVMNVLGIGAKDWLHRITRWRAPAKWYAIVILLPIAIMTIATLAMFILPIDVQMDEVVNKLPGYLPTLILITLIAGLGEEPGWRGLALPRLQTLYSPMIATAILGAIWAFWHFPLVLVDEEFRSMGISDPFLLLGVLMTTMMMIASLAFIYTWIYNRTGNVVLMMLLHGSVTTAISVFLPLSYEASHGPSYPLVLLTITATIVVIDIMIILATKGRLGYEGETHSI